MNLTYILQLDFKEVRPSGMKKKAPPRNYVISSPLPCREQIGKT